MRGGERWLLLPAVLVMGALFGGGLIWAAAESLGLATAHTDPGFDAYRRAISSPGFLAGLSMSLWIAGASTFLSAGLGLAVALAVRDALSRPGPSLLLWLPLPVPHLIAGVLIIVTLGGGGHLARVLDGFTPLSLHGPWALGAILAYVWKETPFIALFVAGHLQTLPRGLDGTARVLGASPAQTFRRVTWPLIRPSLLAAAAITFLFSFGAFEVPFLFGISHPIPLPVLAHQAYMSTALVDRPLAMAIDILLALSSAALALLCLAAWNWSRKKVGAK